MEKLFERNTRIFKAGMYVLMAAGFLFLCFFIRTRSLTILDSDLSSEMILGRMLADENRILSPNFYYGTELRILYVTQIYALLFRFTDDWILVRVCGEIVMDLILLASVWCLCGGLGIRKFFPILGFAFILPFSKIYFEYVLTGVYYIPCIACSFFAIGMALFFFRSRKRRTETILLAGSGLLALVISLIGFRQLVMFYFPFFLSAMLLVALDCFRGKIPVRQSDYRRLALIAGADLAACLIGCIINIGVLTRRYSVADWTGLSFVRLDPDRVVNSIAGMITNLGYRESAFSVTTLISNGYAFLLVLVCVVSCILSLGKRRSENRESTIISAFFVCAFTVFVALYSLTDMVYYDLYSIPVAVFVIPVAVMGVVYYFGDIRLRSAACAFFILALCIMSVSAYKTYFRTDRTAEKREVAAYLAENDYMNGYATFWNANVLTELSNGAIDVYNWEDAQMLPYVDDIDDIQHWLQKTSHSTDKPAGKVFQFLAREEIHDCNWKSGLADEDIVFETKNYVVYGYESYEDMIRHISHYDFDPGEMITGESDTEDETVVYTTPDMYLYEGTYRVDIEGTGLAACELLAKYFDRDLDRSVQYSVTTDTADTHISARVTVPENRDRSRLELTVSSGDLPMISHIHIER